ncbi:hypothetical protein RH915_02410 [Serpentinicella sp. ANB-PHB4]|uniref:hypothetical protein n=1 Tax=Serpentinicella sp. ANB-PHB4 TaxID=3074076 RepID=UPI002859A37B|nr:hypothetical protein [Serpentinicella sp. ANB-PHB4]MDR5658335.1 hypothetical protein [Serpentinicella sp. ANB-PHB4]
MFLREETNEDVELENICIKFLQMLEQLKKDGKVSEEEYLDHSRAKKEFLEYLKKKRSG